LAGTAFLAGAAFLAGFADAAMGSPVPRRQSPDRPAARPRCPISHGC
jgi:hypothetical protein